MTTQITSESNRTFRECHALLSGRGVKKYGKTIVGGRKIVPEILEKRPGIVESWLGVPGATPPPDLPRGIDCYTLSRDLFNELDVNGTRYPLLVVHVPEFEPFNEETFQGKTALFIPFQDPSNIGAVIRSAVAFGLEHIVLLREAANPYLPKAIRAAGTQLFDVTFYNGPSIADISSLTRPVISLSQHGHDIRSFQFPDVFFLLSGLEGAGVPDGVNTDYSVSIPMNEGVESLNATVATSIFLYEWRRSLDGFDLQ